MDNRLKANLVYDYMFCKIPMSKSGDDLEHPERCSGEGLLGDYGKRYGLSYQDIKSTLNSCGVITEGKWGGQDLGKFRKYKDTITVNDIEGFFNSRQSNISDYVDNIINNREYDNSKESKMDDSYESEYNTLSTIPDDEYSGYSSRSISRNRGSIGNFSYKSYSKNSSLKIIKLVVAAILAITVIITVVNFIGNLATGVKTSISSSYNVETFEYKDRHFVGYKKHNKPDGVCYSYKLDNNVIGYYSGGKLKGYGLSESSGSVYIGVFKNDNLTGYGAHIYNDTVYIGKFSNGVPKGYGYMINSSGEHIVKYKNPKSDDYSSYVTIIATKSGENWVKPNGKTFKVSNNTYKGMEFTGTKTVTIGDIKFNAGSGAVTYKNSDVELSYTSSSMTYNTRASSNSAGVSMTHTSSGSVYGTYAYEKGSGLIVSNFSIG